MLAVRLTFGVSMVRCAMASQDFEDGGQKGEASLMGPSPQNGDE
jgi:hypothetical protein